MSELTEKNKRRATTDLPPLRTYLVNSDLKPHDGSGFAYEIATTEDPQTLYVWVNTRHTVGAAALIQELEQRTSLQMGGKSYSIHRCHFVRRYRRGYLSVIITDDESM